MNTIWRNLPEPDGRGVLLHITAAGAEAIGIEPGTVPHAFNEHINSAGEPAAGPPTRADGAPVEDAPKRRGRARKTAPTRADVARAPKTRGGTKQEQVVAMLRRKQGATIAEIVAATEWASHTVRGFFAGALKKMVWMPLSPPASQCAKLVVLNSQGRGEGIHGGSYHHRRGSGKERVPAAWCSC
jgi:hypothetical protein